MTFKPTQETTRSFRDARPKSGDGPGPADPPVEGGTELPTLGILLARRDTALPVGDILDIGRAVLSALGLLHERGVRHGRITPDTIVMRDGRWQLGEPADPDEEGGPAAYTPPEGWSGPQSDLYSLGVVLFQMATGEPPDLVMDFVHAALPLPGDDPRCALLTKVIRSACASNPSARYGSAEAMDQAITSASKPPTRRLRRIVTAAASIAIAVATVVAPIVWYGATATPDAGDPVDVVSVHLPHYRSAGRKDRRIGDIGLTTSEAHVDDAVAISVELSVKAHCYVIALNPDGEIHLCHPSDWRTVPTALRRFDCPLSPLGGPSTYRLTKGVGMQGFVVIASREPLPSYGKWIAGVGRLPWQQFESGGVWRFDGSKLEAVRHGRGDQSPSSESVAPFVATLYAIDAIEGVDTVEGVAFPVRAAEED